LPFSPVSTLCAPSAIPGHCGRWSEPYDGPSSRRYPVSNRNKPDLYGDPPTPEERRQARYLFWVLPLVLIAPNAGRLGKALGIKASHDVLLYGTIGMGVVCIAGAILSYRSARIKVARDLAELTKDAR
jgi:hypothetical protein